MLSSRSLRVALPVVALVAFGSFTVMPGQAKKAAAPAPKAAAPAAKPAAPAAHSSAPAAAGGHTAAGGASTTSASHGPTTSGGSKVTTTSGTHTTTTAGGGAHTTMAGGHPAAGGVGGRAGEAGRPGGAGSHMAERGPMAHAGPSRDREVHLAGGNGVRMRPDGRAADFHDSRRGMDIHHNLAGGGRRVSVERADHSRLVYERGRPGYIGHPYAYRGHEYERRAYYYNGRPYNRFYNPYEYHGVHMEVYAPYRYYGPGFYGWAYNPWAAPVAYGWGWGGNPWYGYYGAYFTPYPVYASSSLWLTDYMIAATLQASYAAAAASGPPQAFAADAAPLTPDVKQLVADEVQRQLALENNEAAQNTQGQAPEPGSSGIQRMLSDGKPHAFIAGAEVDVVDSTGAECAVTDGDVLSLKAPPAPDASEAQMLVLSSKGGKECRKMSVVSVPIEDLQEMQNHMRETIDLGLADLQTKQGTGGLPAAPPSAKVAPVVAQFAAEAPAPEPDGEKELQAQAAQADQSEAELTKEAGASAGAGGPSAGAESVAPAVPAPAAAPVSVDIKPGQSIASVTAALGEPMHKAVIGTKSIYSYKDMKVTFINGKVTNIE